MATLAAGGFFPPLKPPDPLSQPNSGITPDPNSQSKAGKTYASIVNGSGYGFDNIAVAKTFPRISISKRQCSWINGVPLVAFSQEEIDKAAEPLKFSLVAKFVGPRPSVDDIRAAIHSSWGLKGEPFVGIINSNHLLLRFQSEYDFIKAWAKEVYVVKGINFKVFPWSTDFHPGIESSLEAVWVRFPLVPCHMFEEGFLASIVSAAGKFLCMDHATLWRTRPALARVCIELDLRKPLPSMVEVMEGNKKRRQRLEYERIPIFCSHCWIRGHPFSHCPNKNHHIVKPGLNLNMQRSTTSNEVNKINSKTNEEILVPENNSKQKVSTKTWVEETFYNKKTSRSLQVLRKKPRFKWIVKKKLEAKNDSVKAVLEDFVKENLDKENVHVSNDVVKENSVSQANNLNDNCFEDKVPENYSVNNYSTTDSFLNNDVNLNKAADLISIVVEEKESSCSDLDNMADLKFKRKSTSTDDLMKLTDDINIDRGQFSEGDTKKVHSPKDKEFFQSESLVLEKKIKGKFWDNNENSDEEDEDINIEALEDICMTKDEEHGKDLEDGKLDYEIEDTNVKRLTPENINSIKNLFNKYKEQAEQSIAIYKSHLSEDNYQAGIVDDSSEEDCDISIKSNHDPIEEITLKNICSRAYNSESAVSSSDEDEVDKDFQSARSNRRRKFKKSSPIIMTTRSKSRALRG